MQNHSDSDLLILDNPDTPQPTPLSPWRILVVDDDEEVHNATRFALSGVHLLGQPLELLHAYSAREAEQLLLCETDIAAILLDVVMESNDAGLRLAERIRHDLGLHDLRIVLRTGQPGYAPEVDVISRYDINDYRTKNELTHDRLLATLTAALRSYQQIHALNTTRQSLRNIIDATRDLLSRGDIRSFAKGVLVQINSLLPMNQGGLIVVRTQDETHATAGMHMLAASGPFQPLIDRPLDALNDREARALIQRAFVEQSYIHGVGAYALFFPGSSYQLVAYLHDSQDEPIEDDDLRHLFCRNVSLCLDHLSLIQRLQHTALYDPLTSLPNRTSFLDTIEQHIGQRDPPEHLAVLDVDHFNTLAGTIGTEMADRVLCALTKRLRAAFSGEPVHLARIAGDSFGLIGPEIYLQPQRMHTLFANPMEVGDLSLPISVTTSIVPLDEHIDSSLAALTAAFTALKLAKQRRRGGTQVYTNDMSREQLARITLMHELRTADYARDFFLAFQPQFRLIDGVLTGFEALLRWRKPDGTLVPPGQFIHIAEYAGMIVRIGAWVFETACRHLRQLLDEGWRDLGVSVNVSVEQLRDPGFLLMLERTLTDTGIKARSVEIEITESMAMQEIELTLDVLERVKGMGIRIALDDFGTGFSSLAYLQRLNIDRLKVDRSFIAEISRSAQSARIAETVAQLGRQMNLEVLAEGVETPDQVARLVQMGYHSVQGFLYAKPIAFAELSNWLTERDKPREH
ncbi:MAG: EAL domain-containing protein [Gammaproteobacteria bacterium]|nr:EAL domain-containing protein [Gammaproteobacteria bacterium]